MSKSIKSFSEKILAIVLMIAMLLALFPASAFAKTSAKESQYNWSYSSSGSIDNMAVITDGKIADGTPKNVDEANVAWATQFQLNFSNAISQPTFMNGELFLVAEQKLHKIDSDTGEVLATSEESISNRYNYFLVNDGTYIYVQTGTTVSAFDSNLKKVWESKPFKGNQGLSKLYCEGGQIYGATVNTSGEASEIFCLKQSDGSTVWSIEVTRIGGTDGKYTGAYWSGANVIGDYAVIGSEGGIVYSINKNTGEIADKLELGDKFSVRSAIANVDNTLYFTANSSWSEGRVYKVELNENGTFGEAQASGNIGNSIATPVVHNGRMYIGGGGNIYVMDAATLEAIYKIDCNKMKVQDIRLVASEGSDEVYGYATYYNKPGSVIGFSDKTGQKEANYFDMGEVTESFGDGYCANQLVIGPDGTLYIANDDYALIAVEGNKAYLNTLSSNTGKWKNEFAPAVSSNELVVDRDVDSVALSFEASDGSKVIYEGKEVTSVINVDVESGTKEVTLLVQNGTKEREYTVSVRKAENETGLALAGGGTNNNADSINTIYRADGNLYVIEEVGEAKTFIGTIDENATVEWEIVSGNEIEAIEISSPYDEKDGQKYSHYVNWGSDYEGTTLAKVTVTAEDGVTKQDYYIIVTAGDETTYKFAKKLSLSLKNKTVTVGEDGTKLQATVTEYIGKADELTYDKIVWKSSDESVATVDSNGNVKALSNGVATITATNGPASDSCKVVVDMDTITAYVSIADSGEFVSSASGEMVASLPVTVEDLNDDGKFSVDETLRAAHEEYYEGGAEAGYGSEEGEYGLSMTRLWGDDSGVFGYWNDNVSCWSLADEVKNGGHVKAFIYTDKENWSDKYTCFENEKYSVEAGRTIELKLLEAGYDSNWNTVFSGSKGAKIAVLAEGEKNVSQDSRAVDMVTDENGVVTVSFDKAGNYKVVAYKEDGSIVPSLCPVEVKGDEASENGGASDNSNTSNSGDTPKTGDDTNMMLWALIALTACMGGASMVKVERRQK